MDEDLKTQFSEMSDDEMLSLGQQYASLTDEAQTLVRDEFKRRNLETPDAKQPEQSPGFRTLRTIRRYRDLSEALIAHSALESSGVESFVQDANFVRLDWGVSNAIGGIRLQVSEADVETAEAVLTQPIPSEIAIPGDVDYGQPVCPRCGSLDTSFRSSNDGLRVATLFFVGVPLPQTGPKDYWHCEECQLEWMDEPNYDSGGNAF
jgi:hypothetical protein